MQLVVKIVSLHHEPVISALKTPAQTQAQIDLSSSKVQLSDDLNADLRRLKELQALLNRNFNEAEKGAHESIVTFPRNQTYLFEKKKAVIAALTYTEH